jgi:putative ABC transport system permease protein
VSALCTECPVDTFAREIEKKLPYVEARTVKQLVSAEMGILLKIEKLLLLVTLAALLASALGVMTTMTTAVIERQREIGLMKCLGAENARIAALFFAEAALIGVIGGLLGYFAGILLAKFIGISVFGVTIASRIEVLPVAICVSLAVVVLASALPVRRATKVDPVVVLRGE